MKRFFYRALVCLCIPLSLIIPSSCGDPIDPDIDIPADATVAIEFVGAAVACLSEGENEWNVDIFVDTFSGPYSDRAYAFEVSDNNSTNFDIEVPKTGMYTIMVEIYPNSSTSCMACCSNMCAPDDTGEPEFGGTRTFTAGSLTHNVPVNLVECDCC